MSWTNVPKASEDTAPGPDDARPWGMLLLITSVIGVQSTSIITGWGKTAKPAVSSWTAVAKPTSSVWSMVAKPTS